MKKQDGEVTQEKGTSQTTIDVLDLEIQSCLVA